MSAAEVAELGKGVGAGVKGGANGGEVADEIAGSIRNVNPGYPAAGRN